MGKALQRATILPACQQGSGTVAGEHSLGKIITPAAANNLLLRAGRFQSAKLPCVCLVQAHGSQK